MAETSNISPPQPQIKVLKISAVAPAVPTERQRLFLSNLDLFWLPINNVPRLLFYRNSSTNEYIPVVEKLKISLSSVLVYFYPLAGRLVKGESSRPEVDCNDEGVEFIEASIDISFQDLEKDGFQRRPYFENLVKMANQSRNDDFTAPLLSIQVTTFEGGGICLGTTIHHVVADGNSLWHFMKSWAECSRRLPVSKPPQHSRTVFKRENKTPQSISFRAVLTDRINGTQIVRFVPDDSQKEQSVSGNDFQKRLRMDKKSEDFSYSTFHFTEKHIQHLKQTSGASSSFVAVAAHFWRSIMKAREVPEDETVYFGALADCRGRVKPPLPPTYFGNCLCVGIALTTAKKLLNEDISFAAGVIKEVIKSNTTEEQVSNMIEWLESPENGFLAMFREIGLLRYGTNVVSSPRFPVYEIDYGWGKPVNVQIPCINGIGSMVIDGTIEAGGSMVISTCLLHHQMETLSRLLFVPLG